MAGVADSSGYGWAICKALAEAGATVTVGTWPPVLGIFEKSLKKGSFDEDMKLEDGSLFKIAKVRFACFCSCARFLVNSLNHSVLCAYTNVKKTCRQV